MSINHYHCPSDFPETHLWSQYIIPKTISFISNPNIEDDQELLSMTHHNYNTNNYANEEKIPKVPLFEKPLTPSDVGKLNRLVVPKQHAERYFPSNGAESVSVSEKGFLLSFEDDDDVAKSWRFRYSYWNSSQSYVLTKGWSRFIKEKKLGAGDVVLFSRHRADAARLFIGWRRRSSGGGGHSPTAAGGGGSKVVHSNSSPYPNNHHQSLSSIQNQAHCVDSGSVVLNQTIAPSGNCRKLRLFGVNLECQLADESDSSTPNDSPMSSQSEAYQHQYHQYYYNHMDINFSGGEDVYRQG